MSTAEQIINFTRGVPAVEVFPIPQLQVCAAEILEKHGSTVLQYHNAFGYLPLREWLGQKHNIHPDNILVSNGSLQLEVILTGILTEAGDSVLVEEPSYDRAITAFKRHGLEVLGVPLEEDGYNVDILEHLVKEKNPKFFYLIPDFQNPRGITTSLRKREKLVDLAEAHNFWIFEDNPYRELRYWGEEIPSIFSLGSEKVLFFSSFSKVLSPGIRVGYLVGPKSEVAKAAKYAEDTYVTPNMLSQGIVAEYCQKGWLGPNIKRLIELYRPRLGAVISAIEKFLPDVPRSNPEGGFFIGVDLPPGVDISLFRSKAHDLGVMLSDGTGFFTDGSGEAFLRLPFCALTTEEIQEGIKRLGSLIN